MGKFDFWKTDGFLGVMVVVIAIDEAGILSIGRGPCLRPAAWP